jgi:eukaryotic-like serine/threonine-protein kinase
MIGETVTHYRILDKIGEGGMGVVYRAQDTRLGRMVAVKFLSARLSQDPLALDRFQREARAASSLNHPNICALFDIGRHGDLPFLVMELVEGTTLRRRINGVPLPIDVSLDFAMQITEALEAAHTLGIVHRDIKSANIFVTDRGQVKILDFGLAKLSAAPGGVDPYSDTTLATPANQPFQATASGQTLGTLAFMSPEQARGDDIDARSDLFSFGAVLYEMVTGREPFSGKTPAMIYDAILRQTPAPPTQINPRVPKDLEHAIGKALDKDRTLRYQTATELAADLKRVKRDSGAGFVAPAPVVSTPPAPRSARSAPAALPRVSRSLPSLRCSVSQSGSHSGCSAARPTRQSTRWPCCRLPRAAPARPPTAST